MSKYKKIVNIMNRINSQINFQELLSIIIDSAKDLLNAEGASLLLLDREKNELIFDVVVSKKGEIIQGSRIKVGEGLAGYVAESGESVISNDVSEDKRFYSEIDHSSGFKTKNIVAVPVMVKDKLIGVLEAVNSKSSNEFEKEDLSTLKYLADAAAVSINNHNLVISLENRVEELTCIYEISQSIYFTFDIEEFLLRILNAVNQVIKAKKCSFVILDKYGKDVEYFVSTQKEKYKIDLESSIMSHVIRTGDPLLVYNVNDDTSILSSGTSDRYQSNSFICVPVKLRDRIIGVLNVTDKPMGLKFDSFDLRILSTIANQVAERYENVKLQKNRIENEKFEKELEIASKIQNFSLSVIPENINRASVDAFTIPASYVGGDFFEISVFDQNNFGVAVGDVSGKGIHAAMFMDIVRNALRYESVHTMEPGELINRVNRWIFRESSSGMFCTLFYSLVDVVNNVFRYTSAGHNLQMFYDKKNDSFEYLETSGKPLGVLGEEEFEVKKKKFRTGDFLVLFSDGLIEKGGVCPIEIDELQRFIQKKRDLSVEEITTGLKELINKDSSKINITDDLTLLIVKFD